MKLSTAILATACMGTLLGVAVGQELPDRIKQAGKVVVANQPNYPPMEYKDPKTNELTGLDIDLGNAVARQLGITPEWADIGFEQMVPSLNTGRVDLIQSGMTDTAERRQAIDFVDYMKTGAQFYTSADRADEFKDPTAFCGKTLGMSRKTSFPAETEKWSATNCVANGKPAITILGTESSADARTQLKQGRLDGAVQGSETLPYLIQLEADTYVIVGEPFTSQNQGMAFAKDNTKLRDAYAKALNEVIASGEYKKIFDKYGLAVAMLDKALINGEPVN